MDPSGNGQTSETQFAALVEALADCGDRRALTDLLSENHPLYDQRGASTIVRMRGWILLALARVGVRDEALGFVLEELETGVDPYLVAAAARALRSYPEPPAFRTSEPPAFRASGLPATLAPFVLRALANIRYKDEPVSFALYGDYALTSEATSPVRELLATVEWLGPCARASIEDLQALRSSLSRQRVQDLDRAIKAVQVPAVSPESTDACCALPGRIGQLVSWTRRERSGPAAIETVTLEDQDGAALTFKEFFTGRPSIVAFFYTRCDNPLKCSLTVAKLATIQRLLDERGLSDRIQIAGITYDPAFDLPDRLRGYGTARGLRASARHRLLRATAGMEPLARHFSLGVNFVGSLVNRHRIELFVLDPRGRIAASFERLHWDEQAIVERATALLNETDDRAAPSGWIGALAAMAVALFPKCPICWATYVSALGIAGLERIPYSPQLVPLLVAVMVINAGASGLRGYSTGRYGAFALTLAGTIAILVALAFPALDGLAGWGAALNVAGALLTAVPQVRTRGVRAETRSRDGTYLTGAMARTLSSSIE